MQAVSLGEIRLPVTILTLKAYVSLGIVFDYSVDGGCWRDSWRDRYS